MRAGPGRDSHYGRLLLGDVNDVLDSSGRPIGEMRASEAVRRTVETEYRACRYRDRRGRTGLSMNFTALRHLAEEWPQVLGTIAYVRRATLPDREADRLSLLDFARVAGNGLLLPPFLLLRAGRDPLDGCVPSFVAAAHKLLAGVFSLAKNLLVVHVATGRPFDVPADPAALARFAEHSGMLVGKTGHEVCAGPPGLIAEALELIAVGHSRTPPDEEAVAGVVGDPERFAHCADALRDILFWHLVVAVRSRELVSTFGGDAELLADFTARGFGAHGLPVDDLGPRAGEALVQGVAALMTDLRTDELEGPLFAFSPGAERCSPGETTARTLAAEADALEMFDRLRATVDECTGR